MKLRKWVDFIPDVASDDSCIHVDLGSGERPRNPFNLSKVIATDYLETFRTNNEYGIEYRAVDLTQNLPFPSDSIFSFSAFDVLEHIPRWERLPNKKITFPFVNLMSEIYRCLKPGGYFIAVTPAYPSSIAFQDPTHVNIITRETLELYFAGRQPWATLHGYGFEGNFEIIVNDWIRTDSRLFDLNSNFRNIKLFTLKDKIRILVRRNRYLLGISRIVRGNSFFENNPSHLLWVVRKPTN